MIGAAAEPDRLLFQGAQPGGGLARAHDLGLGAGDRVGQGPGRGGDPGHPAQNVQRGALGGQNRPGSPGNAGDRIAARDPGAVGAQTLYAQSGVEQFESEEGRLEPGDDTRLARPDHRFDFGMLRHDRIRGDVAGAAEILEQGRAHDRLDDQPHHHRLVSRCQPKASMRSTAWRARPAIAGSTVTSWVMVSSA